MLFNSYVFLLGFLPVTLIGYFAIGRHGRAAAMGWLVCASLFFYGWWDWRFLPLLLVSICFNFGIGAALARHAGTALGRRYLIVGVVANLALLGFFKYADFFIASANYVAGTQLPLLGVVLPIGISFYTFTQIAFLVDAWHGEVKEYRFVNYALFVTYFPHLIAGPILHHKEMMPQFGRPGALRVTARQFEVGLSIFAIGLAKKVLIADNLAGYANPVFSGPDGQTFLTAWLGVLAYGFQLYFDFSGYSDMAIGLSRLFGIKLPLNFNSPYKAGNITDFWRRWHMTLSRFLRDYLYIPLGGNRLGPVRRYVNLIVTMALGGLWHGAGWGFVLWGLMHGVYLSLNHAWQAARARLGIDASHGPMARALSIALTFVVVNIAWVLFRSPNVHDAAMLLRAMAGLEGIAIPDAIASRLGPMWQVLQRLGIRAYLGGGSQFVSGSAWVVAAAILVFAFPNTQEIMCRCAPTFARIRPPTGWLAAALEWRRAPRWGVALALLSGLCLLSMSNPSEFLYFQF